MAVAERSGRFYQENPINHQCGLLRRPRECIIIWPPAARSREFYGWRGGKIFQTLNGGTALPMRHIERFFPNSEKEVIIRLPMDSNKKDGFAPLVFCLWANRVPYGGDEIMRK